ncbi:hypothetical protein E8E15_001423 [Penicillium rubens]|jgi:ADP-ribose pyrophosphatase YjhB (NUDIX family)|uniref:Pc13g11600 protein n=2 Tax=Penicillium chrysogenum species complex TaxID=254878 RepID=B6H4Z6_PENRW|nr:uncharacterized protein N7525_003030 [Penicillium rubens]KZN84005.1 hypothetical protein EN45_111230 [Penicillium chrysogenum]CAP92229.1 Pc13g11600 [Penicillium rubens Wisconsin 54-1255]KAF3030395.1 hypothetical protein E8E15_001423 [Penicillium rubens]KAJ5046081.1 hypothetical protein NUH16_002906 [Penicillium rubens]KAJ5837842.1 hypothetical protein N7525_003030 [Penicillium rubens]
MVANPSPDFPYKGHLNLSPQELDPTKRWVIGAAIFQNNNLENPSLLLLKRAPHEESFANAWELPGGHVEPIDETVADAVKREVREETSQVVVEFIGGIEPMVWESKSQSNFQLNYVVTVRPGDEVKPNADEHVAWIWAREEQIDSLSMTKEMRNVVQNALKFAAQA